MHPELAHYLTSLRLFQYVRWALAGCFVLTASRLLKIGVRLLPERHPARPILHARIARNTATIVPAVRVGVPAWAKRLEQGMLLAMIAVLLTIFAVGVARTTHHFKHHEQERVVDLFER